MGIDSAVRGALLRSLAATLPRGHSDPSAARRILFLRHDRIGDMIATSGILRALAGARRDLQIDVAASEGNAEVIANEPGVHAVHVVGRGLGGILAARRRFAGARYDAVLDGLVLKPSVNSRTALVMWASGAPVRIGIGGRPNDFLYTHRVRPARADASFTEYLGALLEPLGMDPGALDLRPALTFSEQERSAAASFWESIPGQGTRLLVNVSAGGTDRRWPDERFIALVRAIRARRPALRIAVMGSPDERASLERIASAAGGIAVLRPLRDALAIVALASVVFTPDTSIAHAAAAARLPTAVLIQTRQSKFLPYNDRAVPIYTTEDSLRAITVEQALDVLEPLLEMNARA